MIVKSLAVLIVFSKAYIDQISHQISIILIYVSFTVSFLSRRFLHSSINSKACKVAYSISAISLWTCCSLMMTNFCGLIFENTIGYSITGFVIMALILKCYRTDPDLGLLQLSLSNQKNPFTIQRVLEKLCLLYSQAQDGDWSSSVLLDGYIEGLQRSSCLAWNSPLRFERVYEYGGGDRKKGKGVGTGKRGRREVVRTKSMKRSHFQAYHKKERKAFLEYLSRRYFEAVQK